MNKCLLAAVLVFVVFSFSRSANGQSGVLDQTFGVGGKVIISADSTASTKAVVIQTDGKIISGTSTTINSVPYLTLIRYNTDGTFDNSFGINGRINLHYGAYCYLGDIALQPDGKLVVGGTSSDSGYLKGGLLLVRYQPDGTVDSTFGINGFVKTSVPTGYSLSLTCILIKSDGKIVAGGTLSSNAFTEDPLVAQYLPNGQLDSSFNSVGMTTVNFNLASGIQKSVSDMVATADGKIIVTVEAAMVPVNNSGDFLIARILPNGLPDPSFGTNGFTYTDFNNSGEFSYGITMLADSSLVLCGYHRELLPSLDHFALVKYTPGGHVDSTFGRNGIVTTRFNGKNAYGQKIVADPSGKLIVCGYAYSGFWSDNVFDFALAVYNTNGSLDSSFGRNGMLTTDFANGKDMVNAIALQPDGKIVLAGDSYNGHVTSIALSRYERNQFLKYNSIDGIVFVDNNGNGTKEANEHYYNNAKVITKGAADSVVTFTYNGTFSIETDTGVFISEAVAPLNYYNIVPASHTSMFSTYLNTDSVLFGLEPIPGKRDLALWMFPENRARPGFSLRYRIFYKNQGTDTLNTGEIKLVKSNLANYISSLPLPGNITGDTITWSFSNLKPMDTASIELSLKVLNTASMNDTLVSVGSISITPSEQTPSDNSSTIKQIVRGSYDPNDKTENHGGKITTTQVTAGDYLQYTVRFQNTGNDTAFNVYIHDTLDNKLDWSTMQILTASANYQMTITDGNKCLFTFRSIKLVDSFANEPGSHGYIVYRIKPKATVQIGDVITNTAAIYFDYNLPVYTNTEMTTVFAESFPLKLLTFTARKQDNANLLQWTTTNEISVDYFIVERSLNGRDFSTIGRVKANATFSGTGNYSYTDPTRNGKQETLFYRLKMLDKDGQFTYSPIRSLTINNLPLTITIYPNPAKDNLQVEIDLTPTPLQRKGTMQLQVLSMDGKIMLSNSINAVEGSILRSVNINSIPKGSYFLKVITTDKEESIVKFEKL